MKDLRALPKIRDSLSYLYLDQGIIEQDDKSISVFDDTGKVQIPVASLSLLMLGPGTKISHAAVKTTVDAGCLIAWTGEESVRFYAAGVGETRSSSGLMRQAILFSQKETRIEVAKNMYRKRFSEKLSPNLTLEQLRGKEGVRVRSIYEQESKKHGVVWSGRSYDRKNWKNSDIFNRALSAANACLYGVCHSAIVALGYSAGLGFVHVGKQLSFVYDIGDLYKASLTIPLAFDVAVKNPPELERVVRLSLRDEFKNQKILAKIADDIQDLMGEEEQDNVTFNFDPAAPGELAGEDFTIPGGKNHGSDNS